MTFRACESVSYYAKTQRELKHTDLTKSTGFKKTKQKNDKDVKWDVFTELPTPPFLYLSDMEGAACAALKVELMRRTMIISLKAHVGSNLQHKCKSFYRDTTLERFLTFRHTNCLARTYVIFLTSRLRKNSWGTGRQFRMCAEGCRPSWRRVNV